MNSALTAPPSLSVFVETSGCQRLARTKRRMRFRSLGQHIEAWRVFFGNSYTRTHKQQTLSSCRIMGDRTYLRLKIEFNPSCTQISYDLEIDSWAHREGQRDWKPDV